MVVQVQVELEVGVEVEVEVVGAVTAVELSFGGWPRLGGRWPRYSSATASWECDGVRLG